MPSMTINAPGVYEIRSDITQGNPNDHAIRIATGVHYVTILLYARLVGAGGANSNNAAIFADGNADVKIIGMGGSMRGFARNVWLENCFISRVENTLMLDAWFRGISHSGDDPMIVGNDIRNVGGCTFYPNAFCMGIETQGKAPSGLGKAKILRNHIQDVYGIGAGESVGISVSDKGLGGTVQGNTIKNNSAVALGSPPSIGLWVGGNSNVAVVHNHFDGFDHGARFSGTVPGGFVRKNTYRNVVVPVLDQTAGSVVDQAD